MCGAIGLVVEVTFANNTDVLVGIPARDIWSLPIAIGVGKL